MQKIFDPKNTVFLIDASSFLYRSYYALPPLSTKTGEPIQAVFSFCRILKNVIDTYHPQFIALVWDSRGKTVRHELYAEYKATRQATPSDLHTQKERILKFSELISLSSIMQEGVEADDLIASLTKKYLEAGKTIVILTSDKDMGQLLGPNVFILDIFKNELHDVESFEKKIGFPIKNIPLYYALVGDAADNIPGVSGIGKKSAESLAQRFSTMKEVYDSLDTIESTRIRNALAADRDNAFLSEQLFTLHFLKLNIPLETIEFDESSWKNARPFFEELEFKSLLKELGGEAESSATTKTIAQKIEFWEQFNFVCVTTKSEFESLLSNLEKAKYIAFDTETDGLNPLENKLVGISLCDSAETVYYIPVAHQTGETQLELSYALEKLRPLLENQNCKKIAHNAKFDMLVLSSHGVTVQGLVLDTYVASQLVFDEAARLNLKTLSSLLFHEDMLTFEEVTKEEQVKDFPHLSLKLATLYSGADSRQTFRLRDDIERRLKEQNQVVVYEQIEHPLIEVLCAMEETGILCDAATLAHSGEALAKELKKLDGEIRELSGEQQINLNSPQQIRILLFEKLALPPQKKSAGGEYSTDAEVLEALADKHPVPKLLLTYRELAKLKSTYVDALPTYINPKTKKIHTTFFQVKTATGRLSSTNPNLQNIPTDSGFGSKIRAAFIPDQGHLFISADYSQIELRVLAYLSQDTVLMSAFAAGHDIHAETAARLFEVPLAQVSHDQRQIGKRINFSILYGLTPYGLSKDLKITVSDAKKYIDKYFAQYPGVALWMEQVIKFAHERGYVETFWGRRRFIPNIYQKNKTLYAEACRVAINTVAQGTSADLVKQGMIAVYNWCKAESRETKILLQIHDELLIMTPVEQVAHVEKKIQYILQTVVDWNVPLSVTTRFGKNWQEVTK